MILCFHFSRSDLLRRIRTCHIRRRSYVAQCGTWCARCGVPPTYWYSIVVVYVCVQYNTLDVCMCIHIVLCVYVCVCIHVHVCSCAPAWLTDQTAAYLLPQPTYYTTVVCVLSTALSIGHCVCIVQCVCISVHMDVYHSALCSSYTRQYIAIALEQVDSVVVVCIVRTQIVLLYTQWVGQVQYSTQYSVCIVVCCIHYYFLLLLL